MLHLHVKCPLLLSDFNQNWYQNWGEGEQIKTSPTSNVHENLHIGHAIRLNFCQFLLQTRQNRLTEVTVCNLLHPGAAFRTPLQPTWSAGSLATAAATS